MGRERQPVTARMYLGDCLQVLPAIAAGSVDMILTDLPYGTTANKWDAVIPFAPMWAEFLRVCKPSAAIVLTASQPFTSALILSQPDLFRHEWIWQKSNGSNFANTVREPFKKHETICVFSRGKWTYNKQMESAPPQSKERIGRTHRSATGSPNTKEMMGHHTYVFGPERVPSSIQKFTIQRGLHPTQKPVDLMRYLIRTYSNPGETVLDATMGSGTTGVAALAEGRSFVGIESDPKYFVIAQARILSELAA